MNNIDGYDVAIVGVTGLVGETLVTVLQEADFPIRSLYPLASARSIGKTVKFRGESIAVDDLAGFDFSKSQIGFFSAGGAVSAEYAPVAARAGCIVIDNTSQFRYEDDVPLIVPEVNAEAIAGYKRRNIIANPNCSTIQLVVALKPIYDAVGIERINIATYQSVSGAGRSSIEQLAHETVELMSGRPLEGAEREAQIAFNARPQVDVFQDNGYTREEMKIVWETRKILGDDMIRINATAVRIPVFFGHSEAVHIETRDKISADEARAVLNAAPGVSVRDEPRVADYPTAVTDAARGDMVFVGRIREDISHPRGLDLWVVADNIRKGAALNSVQIAEILVESYL